jgi:fused signal recognition particle receptor
MFDGLKDKLNSFKENVEEEAEPVEETADADAETEPADADQPDGREEPVEGEPGTEPEPEPEADADDGDSDRGLMERAKLAATGKEVIEEDDLEGPLEELELALLSSDVEMSVAQEILRGIRENLIGETRSKVKTTGLVVEEALRDALIDVISVGQFDFEERIAEADKPVSIIFTGVNGVGKTTTIAKLSQWLDERGYSTVLANGDTYRAGANEQLQQHADALDERLISHEQGSDPAAVIYDAVEYAEANDVDVVLGDTAGRLHTSNDLMDQLEKIDRVIEPDMTIFVDEAVAGQDAVNRAREFDDAAAIDGAVLTKADADPQGGAAISIAQVTGKPILFLGTGQDYDDLEPFDPAVIVDRLLGHDEEEPGADEAAA